ncbi:MAG: Ig-like domain-containing protein [Planctomycetota bacterium]|nr:Ig-like domain-containing protein [Planctomycetota bacterium]
MRRLFLETLEPRRVLTASLPLTPFAMPAAPLSPAIELLLVNDQLPEADAIVRSAAPDVVARRYDGRQTDTADLVELVTEILAQEQAMRIDSLGLVTHGDAGTIHLSESENWSSQSLVQHDRSLASLGDLFSPGASVLFFSCNVAATDAGRSFLDGFSRLTGATTFASDDLTGNVEGADWDWEYSTSLLQPEPFLLETDSLPALRLLGDGYERNWGWGNDSIDNAFYLGTAGGFEVDALSIHNSFDQDWYSFWLDQNGTSNDYAEILFTHSDGDLDLELYDEDGLLVGLSETTTDHERISLEGMSGEQYYSLRVYGFEGVTNQYDVRVTAPPHHFEGDWKETSDETTLLPGIDPGLGLTQLSIHAASDIDWFWFPLQAAGTDADYIKLYDFDPSRADIDMALYDANNEFLREANGTTDTEYLELDGLEYGWYQLAVFPASNGFISASEYSLDLFGPAPSTVDRYEPNNTFPEAISMGGAENIWDVTVTADDYDIYEFDLSSTGTSAEFVEIHFDHRAGDLELELYDSSNNYLDGSYSVADTERIDFRQLPAGSYKAVVFGATETDTGDYHLKFHYPPPLAADPREDDDSWDTATDLGLVSDITRVTGQSVDQANDDDWFRFQLADWGIPGDFLEIQFEHQRGDLGIALYEKAGQEFIPIWYADGSSGVEHIDLADLPPITYYLQVYGLGATNPFYDLVISQPRQLVADRFEPNDLTSASLQLGTLHKNIQLDGLSIHNEVDVDHFTFTTTGPADSGDSVRIDFNGYQSDLDLLLYDSSWNLVRSSTGVETSNEQVSLDQLPAGVYHVSIDGYNGSTAATYSLSITPPTLVTWWLDNYDQGAGNNTPASATRLTSTSAGTLHQATLLQELTIHDASDVDYFQFTTLGTGIAANTVTIDYERALGDLDLDLLDAGGNLLRVATERGGRELIELDGLPAGTYYARVSGAAAATNGYQLNVLPPRSSTPAENAGDWTIMVYITASNLYPFAFDDINEMEIAALDLPSSVNIAVFWDQSSDFPTYATPGEAAWGDAGRAIIVGDSHASQVASSFERTGERDSSDPATLIEFIDWASATRPADNYGLVMWDHGSGLAGFNNDDADGLLDTDGVFTTQELVTALQSLAIDIDLLAFDECLMAMLEVGYELKDVADVIVASQELEGGQGYDYANLFTPLNAHPGQVDAEQLGTHFVDTYQAFYQNSGGFLDTTSAIRTSQLPVIADSLKSLVSAAADATGVDWAGIVGARNGSAFYTLDYLRDLGHFLGGITRNATISPDIRDAAASSLLALGNGLVSKTMDQRGSSGSSIYLPGNETIAGYQSQYASFDDATGWNAFSTALAGQAGLLASVNPDWSEANDALHSAYHLGPLPDRDTILPALNLNHTADVDWFSFELTTAGGSNDSIRFTPTDPLNNLTVSLHDSTGMVLASRSGAGSQLLSLDGRQAGNYFFQTRSSDTVVGGYTVTIQTPEAGTGSLVSNSSQAKARSLGNITGSTFFAQQPVAAGTSSWFNFDTAISLQPMHSSIRIATGEVVTARLYDSGGSLLHSDQGTLTDLSYTATGSGESYTLEITGQAKSTAADILFAVAPTAVGDQYTTPEDNLLTMPASQSILVNDQSPNSSQMVAELVSSPSHGTLSLQPDGSFTFAPETNYFGIDSFTYRLDDGSAQSLPATVTIEIEAVNDVPSFNTLADVSINEDSPERTVPLSGITASGGENQPLRVTASSSNLGLIPAPTVQYTSAASSGTLRFTPAAEQSGSSVITVTLEDGGIDADLSTPGDNATYQQDFTVTVNDINDRPGMTAVDDQVILEDAAEQSLNLAGISAGPAESQPLRLTAFSENTNLIPSPTIEYSSAASTGTLRYRPLPDAHGNVILTVVVEDGGFDNNLATSGDNASFTTSFLVTVSPVNDPPTLDPISNITIDEDAPERTISLGGITAGPLESQPLAVWAISDNTALIDHPAVFYNSAESTGFLKITPRPDAHGSATITVTVEDGGPDGLLSTPADNLVSEQTWTVTVNSVEDRPRAADDRYDVDEGTTLVVSAAEGVLANDLDPEGDSMLAELVSSTSHGSLTFHSDGSFQYTPEVGFNRSDTFDYRAKDAGGAGAPARVTIAVNSAHPFHNSLAPMDVNDDGTVNAQDALTIINDINLNGIRELPAERLEGAVAPLLDVNRDNRITPLDILIIINYLNELADAEGEGEAPLIEHVETMVSHQQSTKTGDARQSPTRPFTAGPPVTLPVPHWHEGVDGMFADWPDRNRPFVEDTLQDSEFLDDDLLFLLCE